MSRREFLRAIMGELEYLKSIGVDYMLLPQGRPWLEGLRESLEGCRSCASSMGTVWPQGSEGAKVVFITGLPGDNTREGSFFSPQEDELFSKILRAMGLDREDYYITALLKCRVEPEQLDEAISNCVKYLDEELKRLEPVAIVTLGGLPLRVLTGELEPVERVTGRFYTYGGIRVMPVVHPGVMLEREELKKGCWMALKKVMALYR